MFSVKKITCLLFILCFSAGIADARPVPSNIVIDAKTGEVLYSKNPNTRHYPASLTKLMTLYITFEALEQGLIKKDDELKVSRTAANRSPSRLGLIPGDTITVAEAIDALIVKSANDCATVLAEGLGYSEPLFAEKMTEVAQTLGMKNTVFKNASGLPNRKQITTARDMVTLAAALYYHFPQYYDLFSKREFTYKDKTYYSHNNILKSFEGADGMKTGYIAAAGFNIITSAWRDGERVIAVALGYNTQDERDQAVARLMEKGFRKLAQNNADKPHTTYVKLDSEDFRLTAEPAFGGNDDESGEQAEKAEQAEKTSPDAVWMVQIGAFSNYAKARVYAQKIRRRYQRLSSRNVRVQPAENNSTIVYRSQLFSLTKDNAQAICKDLQKENKSCIVLPMEQKQQLAMAE